MTEGVLNGFIILSFSILVLALLLKKLKQPYFIAYIIAGVLLGSEILGAINETAAIKQLGELGVVLLMFFIGSEINLPHLSKNFRKPLLGAFSQLLLSFGFMCLIGYFFEWSWAIIILLSFVISLSSSAIIFQHLSNTGKNHSKLGLLTSGVLIMQDVFFVPMMLVINFMAKSDLDLMETIEILIGSLLVLLFFRVAVARKMVKIPFSKHLKKDHDLQVFFGFILCFSVAGITHWFGLSAALGAFMAGTIIGQDKALKWLEHASIPFRVFFLALFFLSIGLQIKLDFLL